jgi:hypothetical protein
VVKSLESSFSKVEDEREERFSVIEAADNVDFIIKQMIMEAKQEYAAIVSRDALRRLGETGLLDVIISAKRRGLMVRMISEIDNSNISMARVLLKHVELRRTSGILLYVDIFDRKEMLFGPAMTDIELTSMGRDFDLWTNNAKFIQGMYALFERLWQISPNTYPYWSLAVE